MHSLPETGFLRLSQIIGYPGRLADPGDPTARPARARRAAKPPIPALIPVGKSAWWIGVKSGRYPKPVKIGPRATGWTVQSIRVLIESLAQRGTPAVQVGGSK